MNPYTFQILGVIWVCIIGFIVYIRNQSHNVLITCGLLITILLIAPSADNTELILDTEELEWLDTMLTTNDIEEKRRCHHILRQLLQERSLAKKINVNHIKLSKILDYHAPQSPLPINDMI